MSSPTKTLHEAGIEHHALATRLQREGADAFDRSWRSLLASIATKHEQLTLPVRPDDHKEI